MLFIFYFCLGLIAGSFLNAVIFRLHSGESFVSGRSRCMRCKKELSPADLVPLFSFVWLGGKCRYCQARLSWQYPLVEFATGLVFAFFFWDAFYRFDLLLLKNLVLAGTLIVIAVYDWKHFLILDRVVYPSAAFALVINLALDMTTGCSLLSVNCFTLGGALAALLAAGFFFMQYALSGGRWIGFGDVKLGLLLGLAVGWPNILVLLFLAYVLGAVAGVGLILTKGKTMSTAVPFGTFLGVSAIITMLTGPAIIEWYLKLLGF